MSASDTIQTKYRPEKWEDVIGQELAVKSLRKAIESKLSRAFLFVGPFGTGKTTLARIAATELGCTPQNLLEVDAATETGIGDMRTVMDTLAYRPIGGGSKAVIIDEAHGLSKQAWTSLLKSMEEPPAWACWFLCTTDAAKVPANVASRCLRVELKPVGSRAIEDLLFDVAEKEKLDLGKEDESILVLCAKEANGSPRQALSNLVAVLGASTKAEAAALLRSAEASPAAFELARLLNKGAPWREVQVLLEELKDTSPESIRHVVRGYMTKVVLGAKSDNDARDAMAVLEHFSQPFHPSDQMTPVVLACGRLILGS